MSPRAAAWLAWALAGLSVAMFVATVVLYFLTRSVQPPSSWGTAGVSVVLIFGVPFLAFSPWWAPLSPPGTLKTP